MKFFKPFPAAGTVFYGSLFCLVTGLTGHYSHAMSTTLPTPLVCPTGAICVNNCEELAAHPEVVSEDVTVCGLYFNNPQFFPHSQPHRHVVKIPSSFHDLHRPEMPRMPIPIMTQPNTLFIFDSEAEPALPEEQQVEYDLPGNYVLPSNSSFVGNSRSGKKPEITIPRGGRSGFVISTKDGSADYLLADIEIDSREFRTSNLHQGVLDLKMAASVALHKVKVVREPVTPSSGSGAPSSISAIELGCLGNATPSYQITESEIDIEEQEEGGPYLFGGGPAFSIEGCEAKNFTANLLISNSEVKITEVGASHVFHDRVFQFDSELLLSPELHFKSGSNCNRITIDSDENLTMALAFIPENQSGERVFTGLFGLDNGTALGMDQVPAQEGSGTEYQTVLASWMEWGVMEPTCSDQAVTSTQSQEMTASSFLMTSVTTMGTAMPSMSMGIDDSPDMLTTSATPSVAPTTTSVGPSSSAPASTTRSLSTPVPTPSTSATATPTMEPVLKHFDDCEHIVRAGGDEASLDKDICDQYFNHIDAFEDRMPQRQIVKVPYSFSVNAGYGALTDLLHEPDTLYIFSADGGTLAEDELVEYDVPHNYVMRVNSGFVGNRKNGKKPEITVPNTGSGDQVLKADGSDSGYILAHIEVDSRASGSISQNILNLRDAGRVLIDHVTVIATPNRSSGTTALLLGCFSNKMASPVYTVNNSFIDVHVTNMGTTIRRGHAVNVIGCAGGEHQAKLRFKDNIIELDDSQPVDSYNFYGFFLSGNSPAGIKILEGSNCNSVVNLERTPIATDHIGFVSTSNTAKIFEGVLGLKNNLGWGMAQTNGEYSGAVRSWCFWEQQTPSVNVACVTSSVIAESCTPPMESTTVASLPSSTPEVTMTETSTMLTSSEPGPEATSSVIPTPTLASTPVPTSTQGTDSTATTTLSGPVETPAVTSTASTASTMTGGTSLPVTTEPSTAVPQSSTTETPSTTQGIEETTTAADRATTSAFPTVTLSSGVTGMPQGSTTMSSPTPEPQKGEGVELSAGQGVGIGIGTIVTAALIIDQAVTQSVYRLANSEKVKMVANVLGAALPYVFQVGIPNLISHTYHSVFGRKTFTDDPSINLNPMGGADSVDTVSTTADVK